MGEVDLIARKGDLVVFVEVKARAELRAGVDAVTPTAARRINAAGEHWIAREPRLVGINAWHWSDVNTTLHSMPARFAAGTYSLPKTVKLLEQLASKRPSATLRDDGVRAIPPPVVHVCPGIGTDRDVRVDDSLEGQPLATLAAAAD